MEDPASKLRYIQELEDHNNIRTFVIGDLKKLGIKPPKTKKNKSRDDVIVSIAVVGIRSVVFYMHVIYVTVVKIFVQS